MKQKFLILALSAWFCACAQQPQKPILGTTEASSEPQAEDQLEQPDSTPATKPANLPKQELNDSVLYEFLLGEIAGQRGQLNIAAKAYLDIAEATRDPRIAQRATEIALYARQPEAALQAARIWVETDPDSAKARQTLVALLVGARKLEEARPHLEKLLAAEGENIGRGFLQLNGLLAKTADKNEVLNLVRDLTKPHPRVPEAHLALSQAAWNAAQYDMALSEVRKALELRPDWELAALFQGQILQRDSNHLAIDYLHGYLKSHPKAKDVRLSYARLLVAEKNYPQARKEFQQLMADFPKNADVSLAVGLLSMQLNDYDAAEANFKQALSLNYKDQDSVRFYLGQVYEERKRYDEAQRWYGSVGPGELYISAHTRYANMLGKQGKLAQAREYLHQLEPQDLQQKMQIVLAEAQLLRDAGRYQEAFDLLGRTLEKNPNYPDLLYDYAMAAEKLNRLDVLEDNLLKLIKLKPDYAHAYNALGYTLADRNERLSEAVEFIRQALQLAPEDPFIMDSMGWVQYRLGNFKEGADYLQRAFANRPDPEIAAHLGEVLWAQGRREEAQQIWQTSLKDNPGNETLQNVMKKFAGK
ncbi:MAG TPA: tetratricopeptide repeat protein [Burkholderiales bacterium]|nr:tetratricopeptide repeat protein [Burkholderiales bacterium]